MLAALSKLQRLAVSEPLIPPDDQRALIKCGSTELTDRVLKLVEGAPAWVHPLLRFTPPPDPANDSANVPGAAE